MLPKHRPSAQNIGHSSSVAKLKCVHGKFNKTKVANCAKFKSPELVRMAYLPKRNMRILSFERWDVYTCVLHDVDEVVEAAVNQVEAEIDQNDVDRRILWLTLTKDLRSILCGSKESSLLLAFWRKPFDCHKFFLLSDDRKQEGLFNLHQLEHRASQDFGFRREDDQFRRKQGSVSFQPSKKE